MSKLDIALLADYGVTPSASNGQAAGDAEVRYHTPLEIAAATSEHPDWLVRGYVALGACTEIDGKVKASGKTTFVTHLIAAVLDGQPFLGQPTMRTKVVYLTEQTAASFREALGRAGLLGRGDECRIVLRGDVAGMAWTDLVARVVADARRDGYGLLVVDTFAKLSGLRDENDAGAGAGAMSPLQDAAHAGMAVVLARHDRKGAGEVGESGRGSSAISGDVDIILALRRPEGNQPSNRRVIESLSRFSETPEKVVIELTTEGYVLLGESEAVALADAIRFVSGLLGVENERNPFGWSVEELLAEADGGIDRSAMRRALRELEYRAEIVVNGRGVKGDPKRYRLTDSVSGLTNGVSDQKRISRLA